jgi:biopolymer transport protein TolR
MALSTSGSSAVSSEINVTPLIDVLLVLLIIFMVIVPVMPHGLPSLLPQPPKQPTRSEPDNPLVVQVSAAPGGGVRYALNQKSLDRAALAQELTQAMAARRDKVLFVRGERGLEFRDIAEVIGLGRQADAERIGIVTLAVEAGR